MCFFFQKLVYFYSLVLGLISNLHLKGLTHMSLLIGSTSPATDAMILLSSSSFVPYVPGDNAVLKFNATKTHLHYL